jgi:tetratricopeptide (TPR) repeat protein
LIAHAEKAANIDPAAVGPKVLLVDAYKEKGDAYKKENDHLSAIETYRRALEIDSSNPKTMLSLAIAYLQTKQYGESVKLLDSVVKINPDYGTAYQYLGFAHTMLKQRNLALENYLKAVAIDKNDWKARKGLGVIYMLKGLKAQDPVYRAMAIEQWNFSLEVNPNQFKLITLIEKHTR